MDRSVKRDIRKRYGLLKSQADNTGQTDTFLCQGCGKPVRTIVKDPGVIPMGIECPYCNGNAMHSEEDYTNVEITHEWYRPALDEVYSMAEGHLFTVMMILNGGLLRREI